MRKWIFILAALGIIGILGYNYIYQEHRDIQEETAEYRLTTEKISQEFITMQTQAEQNYLNKTIEVSGIITDFETNSVSLDDKVICMFTKSIKSNLNHSTVVTIKGRVIGFDDLLEQVKLDQCSIKEPN